MTTVGYGDVVPLNSMEVLYTIFVSVLSAGVFGYSMGLISGIFQEIQHSQEEFKNQKYKIQSFMQSRDVDLDIQMQVIKQLEYQFQFKKHGNCDVEEIYDMMSLNLQLEIKKNSYCKLLKNTIIFSKFSQDFLVTLATKIQEITLKTGENLFQQDQIDQRLYFLMQGDIELYMKFGDRHMSLGELKGSKMVIYLSPPIWGGSI